MFSLFDFKDFLLYNLYILDLYSINAQLIEIENYVSESMDLPWIYHDLSARYKFRL